MKKNFLWVLCSYIFIHKKIIFHQSVPLKTMCLGWRHPQTPGFTAQRTFSIGEAESVVYDIYKKNPIPIGHNYIYLFAYVRTNKVKLIMIKSDNITMKSSEET